MTTLVLTVIGRDREGLVSALAEVVADNGGNWERSHLAELAGQFAGIVVVTAPPERVEGLTEALRPISGLLDVVVERGDEKEPHAGRTLTVGILGNDHPGIVHQLSSALAQHRLNIIEMFSEAGDAPMYGGRVFEARMTASVPTDVDLTAVRTTLEDLADDLQVELQLDDVESA